MLPRCFTSIKIHRANHSPRCFSATQLVYLFIVLSCSQIIVVSTNDPTELSEKSGLDHLMKTLNHVKYFQAPRCKYLYSSSIEYLSDRAVRGCSITADASRITRSQLELRQQQNQQQWSGNSGGDVDESSLSWLHNCSINRPVPLTDMVKSDAHMFVYVDVVKAGSDSIRTVLDQNGDYWGDPWWSRTKTALVTRGKERNFFIWSMVRDPITRFLSSVQQAMFRDVCREQLGLKFAPSELHPTSASDFRQKQQRCFDLCVLKLLQGEHVDEHFESQVYRLSGVDKFQNTLNYSFIGKLEEVSSSWPLLYRRLYPQQQQYPMRSFPHKEHDGPPLHLHIKGWHIRALCALYSHDFICFNYEFPRICQDYARTPQLQ